MFFLKESLLTKAAHILYSKNSNIVKYNYNFTPPPPNKVFNNLCYGKAEHLAAIAQSSVSTDPSEI